MSTQKNNNIKSLDKHPGFNAVSWVYFAHDISRPLYEGMSCKFPDEFLPVAAVQSVNHEEIFYLLNMREEDLGEDAKRIRHWSRSMCVGDVVNTPGGLWICDGTGFKPIENGQAVHCALLGLTFRFEVDAWQRPSISQQRFRLTSHRSPGG